MSNTHNCLSPLLPSLVAGNPPYVEKSTQKADNTPRFNDVVRPMSEAFLFHQFSPSKLKNASHRYQGDFIKCCPINLDSPSKLFERAVEIQRVTPFNSFQHIKEIDKNQPELFIFHDSILVVSEPAGKGTQSSVLRANRASNSGSPVSKRIIKISKKPYYSEKELLDRRLSPKSRKDSRIDHFLGTYQTFTHPKEYISICENSDVDLYHFDYKFIEDSVRFVVSQLKDMAGGLHTLHRNGVVHRDIKGGNLLVNYEGKGKVTDTGLAKEDSLGLEHPTLCTPFYAAPFIWPRLKNQLTQIGYQGPKSDVFSFGRTIQYDVILHILKFLSSKYTIDISDLCKNINAARFSLVETDTALERLENTYPGRVILLKTNTTRITYIYPSRHEIHSNTLAAIHLFKEHLSSLEFMRLERLANLAFTLQAENPASLPNMESVERELKEIEELKLEERKEENDFKEISDSDEGLIFCGKINNFVNNGISLLNQMPIELASSVNLKKRPLDVPEEQNKSEVKKVKYTFEA